ncbi:MAG: hypothetical protein U0R72_13815 [Nakamurella multipartita]
MAAMDVLVLPAIGTTSTVDQVLADPIATNTMLGHYTYFGNLPDLCAAVVPAGLTADGRPAAPMVLGLALADDRVLAVAAALSGDPVLAAAPPTGRSRPGEVTLAVVGHHLSGQPRCADLLDRGGWPLATTTTAESYRLLRTGGPTPVPVLVTTPESGAAIEVELWGLPAAALPEILARSSPSVCLGRVALADGRTEIGFVADTSAPTTRISPTSPASAGGGLIWPPASPYPSTSRPRAAQRTEPPLPAHHPGSARVRPHHRPGPAWPLPVRRRGTALVVDMQRDFLLPGGFGGDSGQRRRLVAPGRPPTGRAAGRRPGGRDAGHPHQRGPRTGLRTAHRQSCGGQAVRPDRGPGGAGRILIRGEYGHDIDVDELALIAGEIVIDKPGKGGVLRHQLRGRA